MMLKKILVFGAAAVLLAACESGPTSQAGVKGTGTGAPMTEWGKVVARCGDRVFFEFDSSELQPQARRTVECWAQFLKGNANAPVMIQGNADERGTREYNLALGDRRANSVKNYLVALGIQANRVRTISYGKERPIDPGHDEAAWAKNRNAHAVPQGPTG
jgi:peptidoglycan-associated lipoprotein